MQLLTWLDLLISVSDRLFWVLYGNCDILRLPLTLSRPPLTSFWEVEISVLRKQKSNTSQLKIKRSAVNLGDHSSV